MNSLYNHALKQSQGIKQDLDRLLQEPSAGLQGQISVSLGAFGRSIDEYEGLAKREMIPTKRELGLSRAERFRSEYSEYKAMFDRVQAERKNEERNALFHRRDHPTYEYESPYTPPPTRFEHAQRESTFAQNTESAIDDFISTAQHVLENLTDQHDILKKTQRKVLDTANTLGLSQNL
ncbi:hypothetical protein BZG36_02341 [Bifiguratus adelaidae]|uniref:Protein transport protein BOS1 n=1 Tax=Bifiguratus adelaidae TaxID=1938954 RepID=A0A261Y2V3_9FUNG|nr:hypothetical protein BZG36_02341 [Bifiguratus adelaidae]